LRCVTQVKPGLTYRADPKRGGDLAKGMDDLKAATGTAAGMAVEETKALANSISALDTDLSPQDAGKKLLQVIEDAKFTLERLGVDKELIGYDKDGKSTMGQKVLANDEKYLLPDERRFYGNTKTNPFASTISVGLAMAYVATALRTPLGRTLYSAFCLSLVMFCRKFN